MASVCMHGGQRLRLSVFLYHSSYFFLDRVSPWTCRMPFRLGWLASELLWSSYRCPPPPHAMHRQHHTHQIMWVQKIWTCVLMLCGKHCALLSQLPGPEKSNFCVQLFVYLEFLAFLILHLLIKLNIFKETVLLSCVLRFVFCAYKALSFALDVCVGLPVLFTWPCVTSHTFISLVLWLLYMQTMIPCSQESCVGQWDDARGLFSSAPRRVRGQKYGYHCHHCPYLRPFHKWLNTPLHVIWTVAILRTLLRTPMSSWVTVLVMSASFSVHC